MEIESLLGIKGNRPAIGSNMNREIEDILRVRQPFARSANNTRVHENGTNVINVQEESSNTPAKNKGKGKHIDKDSHRHHHHHHSKSDSHEYRHHRSHKHSHNRSKRN
jgi:hypothetical protein